MKPQQDYQLRVVSNAKKEEVKRGGGGACILHSNKHRATVRRTGKKTEASGAGWEKVKKREVTRKGRERRKLYLSRWCRTPRENFERKEALETAQGEDRGSKKRVVTSEEMTTDRGYRSKRTSRQRKSFQHSFNRMESTECRLPRGARDPGPAVFSAGVLQGRYALH